MGALLLCSLLPASIVECVRECEYQSSTHVHHGLVAAITRRRHVASLRRPAAAGMQRLRGGEDASAPDSNWAARGNAQRHPSLAPYERDAGARGLALHGRHTVLLICGDPRRALALLCTGRRVFAGSACAGADDDLSRQLLAFQAG